MTREEAILWMRVLKHSKINWVGEKAEEEDIIARCEEAEQEAFDMAISALQAEPSDYACWLESIIVTDEPSWLCEDSIDDEWCHKNCDKSSIQAECLRHFYKVLSADAEQTEYKLPGHDEVMEALDKMTLRGDKNE